jgi:predicted 2-oxoglutarate/Fe(II)-dependent dioxygenase YbiX
MAGSAALYTRPDLLSRDRLAEIVARLVAAEGELAAIQAAPGTPLAVCDEVRRAWEIELTDDLSDELVACIGGVHADLESFFSIRLEPCEAVAALRYPPRAFYRTHRDVAAEPGPDGLHRRAVSVVLFLNSATPGPGADFTGGTLRLHDDRGGQCDVVPVAGTLVAFRSSVLHEVLPVDTGTRLSIVTWLQRGPVA